MDYNQSGERKMHGRLRALLATIAMTVLIWHSYLTASSRYHLKKSFRRFREGKINIKYPMALTSTLVGGLLFISQHGPAMNSSEVGILVVPGSAWTRDINNMSRVVDIKAGDGSLSYRYTNQGRTVHDGSGTSIYLVHPALQVSHFVRNASTLPTGI